MSFRRRRCTSGTRWFRLIWSCAPVRLVIRRRRSGVKRLFPEGTEIKRVKTGGVRALVYSVGRQRQGLERNDWL